MSLIGLDIGTTGCKAIVFDASGTILGQSSREYGIDQPHPGWAEQDPELVWNLAWTSLKEAVRAAKSSEVTYSHPQALAISCQGEAVMPVDSDGIALHPAILGMDTRTTVENERLCEQFGDRILFRRTGIPVHTINTLPKLLWLKRNKPEIWRTAYQFLLYEDFFIKRLGGDAVISRCLASRTQMMDIETGEWATDILATCEIQVERLAKLGPIDGGPIGIMKQELVADLGVVGSIELVCGGHDQACAALGSGVTKPGLAMVSTGTAEVVELAMESPSLSFALEQAKISTYRHIVPGIYLAMTLNHSGGLSLRWFRDTLGQSEILMAQQSGEDAYDLLLNTALDGPTPLMFMPHFSGSGTPTLDIASKAAVLGMTFSTDKSMLAKALLEGLTFELRINLDLLQEANIELDTLNAVGGGSRSPMWLQLKADIGQVPLQVPQVTEAACLGAALAAGVGCGVYSSFDEAISQAVSIAYRIEPRPKMIQAYQPRYELYKQLYPLLADYQHRL